MYSMPFRRPLLKHTVDNYPGHSGYIPSPSAYSTIPWTVFRLATFTPTATIAALKPFATGTRLDCVMYEDGDQQYVDPDAENACQYIANGWDITLAQLTNWNPSLNGSDTNCHFDPNYRYCIQAYQAVAAASTIAADPWAASYPIRDQSWTNCSSYAPVPAGESCQEVLDRWDLTIAQFYSWNPAIGATCENLWTNYRYCVRPDVDFIPAPVSVSASTTATKSSLSTSSPSSSGPTPPAGTQSGQPSNCNAWIVAKAGDGCDTVEKAAGISAATFLQLNPAVGSDCSGLWANYAYCIGTSAVTTKAVSTSASKATSKTTSVPASKTTSSGPSAQTQSGEPSNCSKWVVAKAGDTCDSIEKAAGISAAAFLKLNPPVGSDCSGLWAGYAYCIAT